MGMFAVVAVIAIVMSLSFTGARVAFNVNYEGKVIATVSNKKQFGIALQKVVSSVNGSDVESVVSDPSFDATIVLNEGISSEDELATAIIENTDEIVSAASLFINGEQVACVEQGALEAYINSHLNSFAVSGNNCTTEFMEDVKIESGYYMLSELDDVESVHDDISALTVVTRVQQVSEVVVPYKSTVKKTNEKVVGYKAVTTTGVSGLNRVTEDVVLVNGQETSRTNVSTEVISNPVSEVVVVGTARSVASAKQKEAAHNAGFKFPLPAGTWRVSSYYGDGRNHKGVDICANKGTSIYAVADGKVIKSGWNGDYGYCVIIDHGNGIRTLYAHASQLCINAGESVSAGQVIALVGTTGQSTGNHLHFEVSVNGNRIDPAPYIGLD